MVICGTAPPGFDISRLSLCERPSYRTAGAHAIQRTERRDLADGRWLAYQSNDSGRARDLGTPFPDVNSGRWQVSAGGGFQPLWGPDGREMFYRDPTGAVMRVGVERGPGWAAGRQRSCSAPDGTISAPEKRWSHV